MSSRELEEFIRGQCRERGLSLRRLSVASGLSPGTLHNIITRKYRPTVFSLNHVADYLGVKRQYLWQLAGLVDSMDYRDETEFADPRLRFQFAQADKLPESERNLIVDLLKATMGYFRRPAGPTPLADVEPKDTGRAGA